MHVLIAMHDKEILVRNKLVKFQRIAENNKIGGRKIKMSENNKIKY